MLSGEIKGGMSAKDIAKVMQKPVDNVTNVNILASTEGDELYSVDDFEEDSLDKYRQNSYNLYTTTDDFMREVTYSDRHTFARSLANKTSGMADGDIKTVHIYCRDKVYTFVAYGYMQGYISMSEYVDVIEARKRRFEEYYENDVDSNRTVVGLWSKPISNQSGRQVDDVGIPSGRRGPTSDDPLPKDTSNSTREGNNERVRKNTYSQKEADEIVKKLREMYGCDDNKHSDGATDDVLYSTDDDTDSVSNRSLLANALESVAQNDIERTKLAQYKEKIALIEAEQAALGSNLSLQNKKDTDWCPFVWRRWRDKIERLCLSSSRHRRIVVCLRLDASLTLGSPYSLLPAVSLRRKRYSIVFCLLPAPTALEFKSFCLILANKKGHRLVSFLLAEMERFELSRRDNRPTPLAGAPLRPLEYISV